MAASVMCRPVGFRKALAAFLVALALPSAAATHVVTSPQDSGPGTLRDQLTSAAPGDTIEFDPALDGKTILLTNGPLAVAASLTIDASALTNGVTLSGANRSRILEIAGGDAVLRNLTLTEGYSSTTGGAVRVAGADVTAEFDQVRFRENEARSFGGALMISAAKATVRRSEFAGNSGTSAGAIYHQGAGLLVEASRFSGNSGRTAGAILNYGVLELRNSTFEDNHAEENIAGALSVHGAATLHGCVFRTNSAVQVGGALAVLASSRVSATECLFEGNEVFDEPTGDQFSWGGAIHNNGGMTLTNCSIVGNRSGTWAGGIASGEVIATSPELSLIMVGCTIAHNTASLCAGGILAERELLVINCTVAFNAATDSAPGYVDAGGICTSADTTIINSTITGNTSATTGGIFFLSPVDVVSSNWLENTILAGNTGRDALDFNAFAPVYHGGINLLTDLAGNPASILLGQPGVELLLGDPLLTHLGLHGGSTPTSVPGPGSPAINAGIVSANTPVVDQRGYPRQIGAGLDLGAYEAGNAAGYAAWAAERITPGLDASFKGDADNDASCNGFEYLHDTDPLVAQIVRDRGLQIASGGGPIHIRFGLNPAAYDVAVSLRRSDTPGSWEEIYRCLNNAESFSAGIRATHEKNDPTFRVIEDSGLLFPKAFYQLRAELIVP